jgi:hypothetical protein
LAGVGGAERLAILRLIPLEERRDDEIANHPNILKRDRRRSPSPWGRWGWYAGEAWVDRTLTATLIAEMSRSSDAKQQNPAAAKIATQTDREREVITLVAEGLHRTQIAELADTLVPVIVCSFRHGQWGDAVDQLLVGCGDEEGWPHLRVASIGERPMAALVVPPNQTDRVVRPTDGGRYDHPEHQAPY